MQGAKKRDIIETQSQKDSTEKKYDEIPQQEEIYIKRKCQENPKPKKEEEKKYEEKVEPKREYQKTNMSL